MTTTQKPDFNEMVHTVAFGQDSAGLPRAPLVSDSGAVSTSAAVDSAIATDRTDAAPGEAVQVGGKATDPASLPADVAAGKLLAILTDLKGLLLSRPMLPQTPGATPTVQQGVPGRLPQDVTYSIAAGKTVVFHPLQAGVSVVVATAAAAACSATGKVVTFTDKNDDSTTVTAMRALLAASNAAGLVEIQLGTAVVGDTWNHLLTLAETALWATGTLPAGMACAMGDDGYVWPLFILTASNRLKTSTTLDEEIAGEDLANDVLKVEHQYAYGVEANADAAFKNGAGFVHVLMWDCTVAGTFVLRDSVAAGAGTIIKSFTFVVGSGYIVIDAAFTTGLYADFGTATATVNVSYR